MRRLGRPLPALIVCVLVWFFIRASGLPQLGTSVLSEKDSVASIVDYCRSLTPSDADVYRQYIHRLAIEQQFESLEAICNADFVFSSWAAEEIVMASPPIKAVAFCKRLSSGSAAWRDAFIALHCHPKEHIINYLMECASSQEPIVRSVCYHLAGAAGWGDLVEYAMADYDNSTFVGGPNSDEMFLSQVAKNYVQRITDWRDFRVECIGTIEDCPNCIVIQLTPDGIMMDDAARRLTDCDTSSIMGSSVGEETLIKLIFVDEKTTTLETVNRAITRIRSMTQPRQKTVLYIASQFFNP